MDQNKKPVAQTLAAKPNVPASKTTQVPPKPAVNSDRPVDHSALIGRLVSITMRDRAETSYTGVKLESINELGVTMSSNMRGNDYYDFVPLSAVALISAKLKDSDEPAQA